MNIALTGATGFVAGHLIAKLLAAGHELRVLGRRRVDPFPFFRWDLTGEVPQEALESCEAVVHLAGETVAQRWTADSKRRIYASRVDSTKQLVDAMEKRAAKPRVLLAASAVGFYGSCGDQFLTESSQRGTGFLADVVADWEAESRRAESYGIRVVNLRFGVVLGRDGGAFPKMVKPFRFGAGGRLGSGHQWMPWIHVDDATRLIVFALDNTALRGPVNVTAPNPVTNAELTRMLGKALHRPAFVMVPGFALKLILGEMATAVLGSERVVPAAAEAAHFEFSYPHIESALRDLTRH